MRRLRAPLAPPAIALAAGIAAAPWVAGPVAWAAWTLGCGAALTAIACRRLLVGAAGLLLAVAAIGALRAAPVPLPVDHLAWMALPRTTVVEGSVVAEPRSVGPDRLRLLLEHVTVDGEARSGRLLLTVYGEPPPLAAGHRVSASLRLHRATGFRDPGVYDSGARLRREGIHVTGSVAAERLRDLGGPGPSWHVRVGRAARAAIATALPPASAALLGGLLLGDRADLPPEIDEAFRRAGVYHILAVSGFNVALLAGSTWVMLRLLGVGLRLSAAVAMLVVAAFGMVVGPQPSVLRAVIMGTIVLGALVLDREASVLNSLALAAILILAVRPGDLLDPGFQLSFAATAGIVLAPIPRGAITGGLGVSAAAQAAVLPVQLAHFNQLTTLALVANLGVVPLAGLATVVGIAAVALVPITTTGATIAFNAVWPVLLALRAMAAAVAWVPGALVHLPAPSPVSIALYVASLALALAWWRLRQERPRAARLAGPLALGLLAGAGGLEVWPLVRPADGWLRLTVLDVGQGDAIVAEMPDGRVVLVDAGSGGPLRVDAGARVVAPFLWNRGHLRLAAAITTHDDRDHAGGMASVRRDFGVDDDWTGASGRRWFGAAAVTALPTGVSGPRRNDAALVLRIDYGLASFLLASDIGWRTEQALLESSHPLRALVLKVAHHGARDVTSSGFLGAVAPAFAVVSVGARNAYGHPDPRTLARLEEAGTRVARTDHDGAVIFETDGQVLRVTRWAAGVTERHCLDPAAECWSSLEAIPRREETSRGPSERALPEAP